MRLEALSSNELLNFINYNTISATPFSCHETTIFHHHHPPPMEIITSIPSPATAAQPHNSTLTNEKAAVIGDGGRKKKKRKKKARACKNKVEAETQRMTHIVVERNRRKQMNHHLAILRSLMPQSYIKRGDQASIVGGAIVFVKELEHLLQSLEAQKCLLNQQEDPIVHEHTGSLGTNPTEGSEIPQVPIHSYKVVSYPQQAWSRYPNMNTSKSKATIADIEVNLVQTHANLRMVLQKRLTPLSKMVVFLQKFCLSVLHLNVTTLHPLVLYSISLKVEEGSGLSSADQIAGAVHQILALIEEESVLCIDSK